MCIRDRSRGRLSYLTPDRTKPITARKLGDDFDKAAVLAPVSYTHLVLEENTDIEAWDAVIENNDELLEKYIAGEPILSLIHI